MEYGVINIWNEDEERYVPIAAIKGDSYVLTQHDKEEIANIVAEMLAGS